MVLLVMTVNRVPKVRMDPLGLLGHQDLLEVLVSLKVQREQWVSLVTLVCQDLEVQRDHKVPQDKKEMLDLMDS